MSDSIQVLNELFGKLAVATVDNRAEVSTEISSFLNGNIIEHDIPVQFFKQLEEALNNKKTAANALSAVASVASENNLSPSVEPYIVNLTPIITGLAGSKDKETQDLAKVALCALAKAIDPMSVKVFLPFLTASLSSTSKWQEKVADLAAISILVDTAKTQVALRMPELIPVLSEAMWDTKKDVKVAASETITKSTETVENKDIEKFIPQLIACIATPTLVTETVHLLGATTFVAEVTPATLSIMVPLLARGLAERDTSIKRKSAVIIDNMCKLVEDPQVVAPFLGELLPGLKTNSITIADPEAREVTLRGLKTLRRVGNVGEGDVFPEISNAGDIATTKGVWAELTKSINVEVDAKFEPVVTYIAAIAGELIDERIIDQQTWFTHILPYSTVFLKEKNAKEIVDDFRKRAVDNIPQGPNFDDEEEEGEDLCNCEFSLAYGAKILLNKTQLRLKRGRRYGLCGPNGAGKSTLINVLTGELLPTEGEVYTHENCRIAYIKQHAFAHIESHLDKTPSEYIQWRFQTGEDRETMDRANRQINEDDEAGMKKIFEIENTPRRIQEIHARRKFKNSYEYECSFLLGENIGMKSERWVPMSSVDNAWIPRSELVDSHSKLVAEVDMKEALASGQFRALTRKEIESHCAMLGLEAELVSHSRIRGLSGGQKVKLVLAAGTWQRPHLIVLDEPTNYLDRDSLGALSKALKAFEGGVIIITHSAEFTKDLTEEVWAVKDGKMVPSGHNWVSGQGAGPRLTKKEDEGDKFDAMGNKIASAEKKTKLSAADIRKKKKERMAKRKAAKARGEEYVSSDEGL